MQKRKGFRFRSGCGSLEDNTSAKIEDCIGAYAAVNLSTIFGSRTRNTSIPNTLDTDKAKWLARIIGLEAAKNLIDKFGGQSIRFPTLNVYFPEVRDHFIRVQVKHGVKCKDIAEELGITVRSVQEIARWVRGPRDPHVKGLRVSIATARTAGVYRAVLPTALAAIYTTENMTPEVAREAIGFFRLFEPLKTKRSAPRPARPPFEPTTPAPHLLDAWNPHLITEAD